jgi:hypothetical protein
MWYFVGTASFSASNPGWLDGQNGVTKYRDLNINGQYLTAFHWAASQLTLGSTDVMPVTNPGRTLCILLLLLGHIFGSTVVSLFSATIVQYLASKKEQTEMLEQLRLYFVNH